MKSECEIIHRIKRLKYEAQRRMAGFRPISPNPNAIGNVLAYIELANQAEQLEWVIGREVPVLTVNFQAVAKRVYRKRQAAAV